MAADEVPQLLIVLLLAQRFTLLRGRAANSGCVWRLWKSVESWRRSYESSARFLTLRHMGIPAGHLHF